MALLCCNNTSVHFAPSPFHPPRSDLYALLKLSEQRIAALESSQGLVDGQIYGGGLDNDDFDMPGTPKRGNISGELLDLAVSP